MHSSTNELLSMVSEKLLATKSTLKSNNEGTGNVFFNGIFLTDYFTLILAIYMTDEIDCLIAKLLSCLYCI